MIINFGSHNKKHQAFSQSCVWTYDWEPVKGGGSPSCYSPTPEMTNNSNGTLVGNFPQNLAGLNKFNIAVRICVKIGIFYILYLVNTELDILDGALEPLSDLEHDIS